MRFRWLPKHRGEFAGNRSIDSSRPGLVFSFVLRRVVMVIAGNQIQAGVGDYPKCSLLGPPPDGTFNVIEGNYGGDDDEFDDDDDDILL